MPITVLQFFPHRLSARNGGPYTYLHHLKTSMKKNDEVEMVFMEDIMSLESGVGSHEPTPYSRLLTPNFFKKFIPKKWLYNRRITNYLKYAKQTVPESIASLDLSRFDMLHFHEAIDIWRFAHLLQHYKGKILFTPHGPTLYHLELLEEVFHLTKEDISSSVYRELEEIDKRAFMRADAYVLPCAEAIGAYYSDWPVFGELITGKPMRFVITGVPHATYAEDKNAVRTKWKIPPDAFLVSYTGRHSAVKGFDILERAAEQVLTQHKDLYFIVAGKEKGIETFHHPRWIETGWTNDPYSMIHAADVHIIPNRKTYFDLNTLEAMSLGKPVIITNTGGNAIFKTIEADGILFTRQVNYEDIASRIDNCYKQKKSLQLLGDANKITYEKYFTAEKFYQGYIDLYKKMKR